MKEIPILFSTPMVQAILEGRKTMTRRIVNTTRQGWDAQKMQFTKVANYQAEIIGCQAYFKDIDDEHPGHLGIKCPYGQPGDLLWVRESFSIWGFENTEIRFHYTADASTMWVEMGDKFPDAIQFKKVKPSIHMPKAAARIWLQVEEIRVERLQDITEIDAMCEGIKTRPNPENPSETQFYHYLKDKWGPSAIHSFQTLWQKINGPESWDANPWVWVVKFKILSTTGKPQICYKTNEVCKYDCKGLCRESM